VQSMLLVMHVFVFGMVVASGILHGHLNDGRGLPQLPGHTAQLQPHPHSDATDDTTALVGTPLPRRGVENPSGCPTEPVPICSTVNFQFPASTALRPGGNLFNASDLVSASLTVSTVSPTTSDPEGEGSSAPVSIAAFALSDETVGLRVSPWRALRTSC
jgi:hypothetical protein